MPQPQVPGPGFVVPPPGVGVVPIGYPAGFVPQTVPQPPVPPMRELPPRPHSLIVPEPPEQAHEEYTRLSTIDEDEDEDEEPHASLPRADHDSKTSTPTQRSYRPLHSPCVLPVPVGGVPAEELQAELRAVNARVDQLREGLNRLVVSAAPGWY